MNQTQTVFGRHREGYIFPMQLSVKPMGDVFSGVMQPIATNDHFMMFTTVSRRLMGGSIETMRLVGEGIDVENVEVSVRDFIDDETMAILLKAAVECGSVKTIRAMKPVNVRAICVLRFSRLFVSPA